MLHLAPTVNFQMQGTLFIKGLPSPSKEYLQLIPWQNSSVVGDSCWLWSSSICCSQALCGRWILAKSVWRYCSAKKYEDSKSTFLLAYKNVLHILKRCVWHLNPYLAHRMHHKGLTNCNHCCTPAFEEVASIWFQFWHPFLIYSTGTLFFCRLLFFCFSEWLFTCSARVPETSSPRSLTTTFSIGPVYFWPVFGAFNCCISFWK